MPTVTTINGQTYTCNLAAGTTPSPFNFMIDKTEVQCLLAHVPGMGNQNMVPKVWAGNPRIQEELKKRGLSNPTQSQLKEILKDFSEEDSLAKSVESDGGQSDFLYLWQNQFVEGNRRSTLLIGNVEKILVVIFPDSMSEELVMTFVSKKHLAGPLEWESAMRAMTAWKFKEVYKWSLEKIANHFNFSSAKMAKKFIGSYEWLAAAMKMYPDTPANNANGNRPINIGDWSKFHHAYVPTMVKHFEGEAEHDFKDVNGGTDIGDKGNFKWFCNLIHTKKVHDCRQSDNTVAPLIRDADEDGLKILNRDGAEVAHRYLKDKRQGNILVGKMKSTIVEIEGILSSVMEIRKRQSDCKFNEEKVQAQLLLLRIQSFMQRAGAVVNVAASDVTDGL